MNLQLEQKILSHLINNLDEVKRAGVQAIWFDDETHRQLAYTLLNTEKVFMDLSEIELEAKSFYPKSIVSEEWLQALKYEDMFISDLKASVRALEKEHVTGKAHKATLQYAEYPSDKNREGLENALREMNELGIEEDEGELDEPISQLLHELDNEVETGILSYPKLDATLGVGLEKGMLFVLAGRPGKGKTTIAFNIALEAIQRQPETQVDFFSLEMSKIELLKKIIARLTRINSYKFKNAKMALDDEQKLSVINSADWVSRTSLKMHDSKFKLSEIERTIRQRVHENKGEKYLAVVDYAQLVDAEDSRAQRHQQIGIISRTLKKLTNELGIPIILLSQLNRAVENRQSKRPSLSDLRESGDLEQDANVVAFVWSEDETDEELQPVINLSIAKNRGGETGSLHYIFDKPTQTFTETTFTDG